jgi:ABC-type lipoprotein release transport system permease subunit
VDLKDFTCTHESARQKTSSEVSIILSVLLLLVALVLSGIILVALWRRGFIHCTPRKVVGRYSQVTVYPNPAEMEWDDKDLDHILTIPSADRQDVRRGA